MHQRKGGSLVAALALGLALTGAAAPAAAAAAESNGGVRVTTAAGYDKMAAVWYAALRSVPGSIGEATGAPVGGALVGAGSGRCLDEPGSNSANGTQPVVRDCTGAANQRWTAAGQTLQSLGKCLDSPTNATAAGSLVQLWTCTAAANQVWTGR